MKTLHGNLDMAKFTSHGKTASIFMDELAVLYGLTCADNRITSCLKTVEWMEFSDIADKRFPGLINWSDMHGCSYVQNEHFVSYVFWSKSDPYIDRPPVFFLLEDNDRVEALIKEYLVG